MSGFQAVSLTFDFDGPHDLLVAGSLSEAVTAALPGWRVLNSKAGLPADAAPIVGVFAAGDNLAELDAVGFTGLPVLRVSDAASVPQDLADLLADRLREALLDAAEARRAAALLRRENEEQGRRLRMLEHFAHSLGGPRHLKALDWAPTSNSLEVIGAATQRLPLNTTALAAIDLWLPDADTEQALATVVELLDPDGDPIARFSAEPPAGSGAGGWVRFSAAEPLSGLAQDVMMKVIVPPQGALAVGLATAVPDRRFAVHMNGSVATDAPLAARVWRADYLATLPRANAAAASGSGPASHARQIPLSDLGTLELLYRPPLTQDYVVAAYWAREDAVLVHPSADGAVCAILRDADLSRVSSISALVNVAHAESQVLGFAVGACPRGMATRETWRDYIGPYVFLPAGGWGECHCILPSATRSRTDVLLSTMLASKGSNDNAWALFRSLRLASSTAS